MIPFEADYRIIVVTTQTTQELPCTLSVLTGTGSSTTPMTTASTSISTSIPTLKRELREMLVKGRSLSSSSSNCSNKKNNNNNDCLKFSSALLERAQRDFLERRRRWHDESNSSSSSTTLLPGEDDFHRWLNLTKLQTKSRCSRGSGGYFRWTNNDSDETMLVEEETGQNYVDYPPPSYYNAQSVWEPTVDDWKAALQLDDDIRSMV